MVTVITDKLKQQTLNEISTTSKAINEHLNKGRTEKDFVGKFTRYGRSHTTRLVQDGSFEKGLALSFATTGRCNSYPPAKKRICRSKSDPFKDTDVVASWNPEPSSIWTPVKPGSCERSETTSSRSLEFSNKDIFSWSTPPESPIPRPVSANSVLENSTFVPLRLISEESTEGCLNTENARHSKPCLNYCKSIPRSHSHPCFSNIANSGLKRRLSEIDIPRPALDFDKMKARSLGNTSLQKRPLKSPKYSNKRHSSTSPRISNTTKGEKSCLTVAVDLSSSLLITPTASPTSPGQPEASQGGTMTELEDTSHIHDENANTTYYKHYAYQSLSVDSDLDIKLIEEDGSLTDEIRNAFIL